MNYNGRLGMYVFGADSGPIEGIRPGSKQLYNWLRRDSESPGPKSRSAGFTEILRESFRAVKDAYADMWKEGEERVKRRYTDAFLAPFGLDAETVSRNADILIQASLAEAKRTGDFIDMVPDGKGAYTIKT